MDSSIQLEYLWMIPIALGVIAAIVVPLYFIFRKRWNDKNFKHYYANTSRLTLTPQYKSIFRKYRNGLISSVLLLCVALAALTIASAKPVTVQTSEPVKYNRDIVLCLDASGSMYYVDEAIIDKFSQLLDKFQVERISLVMFNSVANQVFPLTDDYDYIKEQFTNVKAAFNGDTSKYDILTYTINGDGASLIGDGLTACLQSFDTSSNSEHRSRSIILATDNLINGTPILTLDQATDIALKDEVKVYGINPGDSDEYHATQVPQDQLYAAEQDMKKQVQKTGGEYYDLSNGSFVSAVVDKIEAEQASAIAAKPVITRTDIPELWIWLASLALVSFFIFAWRLKI